ncbi:hypothetical protein IWX90DRAFT_439970 [Phyllosticta citrichinensis]|uniref:Secreted protein n=1 Tax=Phyllosticta citrichinensis TaxID=1130410 RepID=A0ABR1XKT8_9PEZI
MPSSKRLASLCLGSILRLLLPRRISAEEAGARARHWTTSSSPFLPSLPIPTCDRNSRPLDSPLPLPLSAFVASQTCDKLCHAVPGSWIDSKTVVRVLCIGSLPFQASWIAIDSTSLLGPQS